MSNPACSQGNCSCHLTRDSCCQQQLSLLLTLQAWVVLAAILPNSTLPLHVCPCTWCAAARDTAPGYQHHSAWCWNISSGLKQHQLCMELGRGGVPAGRSPFERRRTQVTNQHRSFWQPDLDVGTVTSLAKLLHPPPCTTIKFPDPFSVQPLIPVTA